MDQDDHPFFSSSDPPPCFLNLNWEQQPMEQFDSALSSLVSSPSNPGDSLVIRELIGRLGSICNSAAPSSSSCYATPLNSPPKLHLSVMDPHHWPADPGFAHRAAKFSSFGAPPLPLSRASSTQSLNEGLGGIVSPATSHSAANARKRKAPDPKGKAKAPKGKDKDKDHPPPSSSPSPSPMLENEDDTNAKRFKRLPSSLLPKAENENENVDAQKKPEEPLKDYIHVRARRGQATDSHSLAERVRREKIGERMKFLQDLVPGCNKVTGKAVMLDEIINYVQSLQHQVEFLSMKLATVNTRLDLNLENCTQQKELNQMCGPAPPQSVYPLEATNTALFSFSNALQPQGTPLQSLGPNALQALYPINHLDSELRRTLSLHLPHLDGYGDAASQSQLGAFWEDDLQSVVQMGFGQDQEAAFSPQNLHGGWVKHKADMNSIP